MNVKIIQTNGGKIAVIGGGEALITDGQSALDLAATINHEHAAQNIVLPKSSICEGFFKLSTGIAGEVAQKFVNYDFRVAIIGDFSGYASNPLHDYIYECNKGGHLYFCPTEADAIERLGGAKSLPKDGNIVLRRAKREDTPLVYELILELAEYEKLSNIVVVTIESLESQLFDKQAAEAVIAEFDGAAVGFALFFSNFSTFMGRSGLYLEDIYIRPPYRGRGIGKAILKELAKTAVERGCGRMEWSCLDWNKPSIDFYLSLGAEPMSDWTVYRLSGGTLKNLAEREL